ncbi:MAG: methyl-accepting chemotaxis protein [bacterium]|jgi:methyl-accepting chemotaxis protein|nr:methyl-accepting chemotaxis protein [bacterium]
MRFRDLKVSTKVMIGFAATMVLIVAMISLSDGRSMRRFGYQKEIERARGLTAFCEQIRTYIGKMNQDQVFDMEALHKSFEEDLAQGKKYDQTRVYRTIPVVASWTAVQEKADELGYEFRVPKNQPRNLRNQPRPGVEQAAVNFLEGIGSVDEITKAGGKVVYPVNPAEAHQTGELGILHIGTETLNAAEGGGKQEINAVRFFRAIRLTQDCLSCHGSPQGEKDIVGFAKEGWKDGEIHGAFEIIAPLQTLDRQIAGAAWMQFSIAIGGLLLGFGVIIALLTMAVKTPLSRLNAMLRDIAEGEGDLTKELHIQSEDEIGQLSRQFNQFVKQLRALIGDIDTASQQVAASSGELAASSQHLASSTTEQSASLEITREAIQNLVESINKNAEHARKTNELTNQSAEEASSGGEAVLETVVAMRQITDKIAIIDDIADQTNLLALNAAIEAARAGEMGKGFAVVAVEVRKLAERSQHAAKEINDLSRISVQKAETAGQMIQKMVPAIQHVSELMNQIAETCDAQTRDANAIQESVVQIDLATQQNSATSEESASASEELSAQSQILQDLVNRFKIDEDNSHPAPSKQQLEWKR